MRDLMAFFAIIPILFFSFKNTFSAYLIWGWAGLIALNLQLYGFMSGVAYVQIFAVITLASIFLRKETGKLVFSANRTSLILIIFGIHGFFSAALAEPNLFRNWELYTNLVKTFLFCLLMPILMVGRYRIHAMVITLALAIGFFGGLDGLKFIASGGAHNANGNPKLGDNNHFAMVVVMIIPLLLYLYHYSARRFVRWGFLAVAVVATLAVVATGSRGGFLAMGILALWIVLKSNRKVSGLLTIALASVLIISTAPERWTSRMNTIDQASSDTSFMGRVTAWKRASAIAVEHPIFGGGFHAGQAPSLFEKFRHKDGFLGFIMTPDVGYPAASHSIYFEVLGDLGFIGLFLFVALIFNAFLTRREIRAMTYAQGSKLVWARDLADMLGGALMVYIVGGALLSAAYFDLPYILIMLMEVLKQQVKRELSSPTPPQSLSD